MGFIFKQNIFLQFLAIFVLVKKAINHVLNFNTTLSLNLFRLILVGKLF
jgi:hypothetical protein